MTTKINLCHDQNAGFLTNNWAWLSTREDIILILSGEGARRASCQSACVRATISRVSPVIEGKRVPWAATPQRGCRCGQRAVGK
jgi:hypothetical protein